MLKKLLKYEFKFIFKVIIIFYLLGLFFALLTRLFLSIDSSLMMNIIGKICSGVTISMIFNIIINNIMRMWYRFKANVYGDESYLTHTLPIDKKTIYTSKILSSIISLFISFIVITLILFIAYYSKENIEIIKNMILPLVDMLDLSMLKMLLSIIFILFLEIICLLQIGYTGIILGHKMDNNKTAFSVLYGFITYIGSQSLVLLSMLVYALFNKDMLSLFTSNEITNIGLLKNIVVFSIIIYTIIIIINYIINIIIFKKGFNVD